MGSVSRPFGKSWHANAGDGCTDRRYGHKLPHDFSYPKCGRFQNSRDRDCESVDKRCQRLNWSLSERPGHLRLVGSAIGLDDYASPAFLGQRQEDFNFQASCAMDFEPQAENEEASL